MSIAKQHQPDNNTRKKPPPRELATNKSANAEVGGMFLQRQFSKNRTRGQFPGGVRINRKNIIF